MPNGEVEKLTVSIEADVSDLLSDTKKGVDEAEKELQDFEKTGTRVFKKVGDEAKKTGDIFKRFGDLGRKAFAALKVAVVAVTAVLGALAIGLKVAFDAAEQGLASIRIRRSFNALARSAGTSGKAIIDAMQEASAGTIREMELMRQANVALQLGVARTPEEFEKLTRSAIVLGRSVGRGPVEALDDLINAAGRRSTEVLDNLGISLADVNAQMEEFSQQEFGKPASQLDQAARNALFMRAALEVADRQAQALGGSVEDIGSNMERARTQIEDFKVGVNEAFLVLIGAASQAGIAMQESFFGPDGFFPLVAEGGNLLAEVFAAIVAGFFATAGTIVKTIIDVKKVITGELSPAEFGSLGNRIGTNFADAFTASLEKIRADFSEVFDPEAAGAEEAGFQVGQSFGDGLEEGLDEGLEAARDRIGELAPEFIDLQAQTNRELEELNESHADAVEEINEAHAGRLADIAAQAAKARTEAQRRAASDLRQLEEETARERADIIEQAQLDLQDLEAETDRAIKEQRDSFNTDELRDTEDHLKAMRRLRQNFIDSLADVIKNRDARALVDLRRRFRREQETNEEDFTTRQQREREDQDLRLQQLRENEALRSEEILANQERDLQRLMEAEQQKRDEINRTLQEELTRIDEQEEAKVERENENFEARLERENEQFTKQQEQLNKALEDRLESEAMALADQDEITEEGARAILETLDEVFGIGGDIDQLMEDFAARRREKFRITVEFEEQIGQPPTGPAPVGGPPQLTEGLIPSFQRGGSMIARRPTLAMFGEAGPEIASFMPISQMQQSATQRQELDVSITMRGSAPPGIRSADRDQIAGVLVSALEEAGVRR